MNLIFTIFAIEYGMKCTREQEKIIFDIRLISDSRKAILRNQSFKLSFNKYSLVHTFRINSKWIYGVTKMLSYENIELCFPEDQFWGHVRSCKVMSGHFEVIWGPSRSFNSIKETTSMFKSLNLWHFRFLFDLQWPWMSLNDLKMTKHDLWGTKVLISGRMSPLFNHLWL